MLKSPDLSATEKCHSIVMIFICAWGFVVDPCPVCGIYFGDQHAMHAHAAQRHAMIFHD